MTFVCSSLNLLHNNFYCCFILIEARLRSLTDHLTLWGHIYIFSPFSNHIHACVHSFPFYFRLSCEIFEKYTEGNFSVNLFVLMILEFEVKNSKKLLNKKIEKYFLACRSITSIHKIEHKFSLNCITQRAYMKKYSNRNIIHSINENPSEDTPKANGMN